MGEWVKVSYSTWYYFDPQLFKEWIGANMATRYLVQVIIEGKVVHMFVSEPDETVQEIRKRVHETLALTFTAYEPVEEKN